MLRIIKIITINGIIKIWIGLIIKIIDINTKPLTIIRITRIFEITNISRFIRYIRIIKRYLPYSRHSRYCVKLVLTVTAVGKILFYARKSQQKVKRSRTNL